MKTRRIQALFTVGALTAAALLAGCGNGGDDGNGSLSINGVAATGAAMAGATITVKCVAGGGTATTAADGSFTITIAAPGATPCLIQATKGSTTLYGFANAAGRVNITPVTDLLVTRALGSDPAAAFANYDGTKGSTIRSNLVAARTYVRDNVEPLAGGLFGDDPLTKPFVVGDADDKLLDQLAASLAAAGKTLGDLHASAAAGTTLRAALPPEETRPHDTLPYAINPTDAAATTFDAMAVASGDVVAMSATSRWAGVLNGAAYRIEVPPNWNGELVMYAHGYVGEGFTLNAVNSLIRRHLIQQGYAWAASSYSANSYDVRAGIEDTNRLANNFTTIAAARGRTLAKPTRNYIIGVSMGGHIAAAAVEAETYATSVNKVRYDGSMPMCGVVGDTALSDTFAGMQAAAHVLTGNAAVPLDQWATIKTAATAALFTNFGAAPPLTPNGASGAAYFSVLQNLTGGARPLVDLGYGYGGSYQAGAYAVFGTTSVTTGLTTKPTGDSSGIVYKVDGQPVLSAQINATAPVATAPADANRLRRDGLRWIPKVNGQPQTPVLTMHTLGDLFVPFNMEQVYRQRLTAKGNGDKVVQRAIRGVTHCDFTNAEMKQGFTDLVAWVKAGTKPAGDDVLTAATVAAPRYGCTYTNDTVDQDDALLSPTTGQLRGLVTSAGRACSQLAP